MGGDMRSVLRPGGADTVKRRAARAGGGGGRMGGEAALVDGVPWPHLRCSLLATLLTLTPWLIRDAAAFHRFVPIDTQTGYGMAGYFNDTARKRPRLRGALEQLLRTPRYRPIFYRPHQNEAQMDEALRSSAMRYARQHPGYIVEGAALNLLRMLGFAPNPTRRNDVRRHTAGPLERDLDGGRRGRFSRVCC